MNSKRTGDPEYRTTGKGMIIGVFFLLLGLSILLKILFKIDIPVFRALFSVLLIYFGIRMLTGTFGMSGLFEWKDRSSIVFSEGRFHAGKGGESEEPTHYSIVFGKGVVDLTELSLERAPHDIEVNVVFGEGIIYVDPNAPVHVVSNAVFGESRMPDDNQVVFGTLNYRTAAAVAANESAITVRTNVVFGSVRIRSKSGAASSPPSSSQMGPSKPTPKESNPVDDDEED